MGAAATILKAAGSPATQFITTKMFDSLESKDEIIDFDKFHTAILQVFTKINACMPGWHYDVPSRKEIEDCFDDWKRISEDEDKEKETEKKKKCLEGLLAKAKPSKTDNRVVYFGMAVPPVAMIGKKYGESMPTLGFLKLVPDLVAIPLATLLGLGVVKYTRVNLKPDEPSQGVTPASSAKIEPSQSGPPDKKKSEETSATSKEVKKDKDRGSSGTSKIT